MNKETLEKIFQAAKKVFAEKGFSGARIDDIADKAGLNKAMIYYHYKSKEDLYKAVLDNFFQKVEYENPNLEHMNSWDRLNACIEIFSKKLEMDRLERFSIITRELVSCGDTFREIRDKYWIPEYVFFHDIITNGVAKGEFFTKEKIDFIVFTIFSHLVYYKISQVTYDNSSIYDSLYPENNREKILEYLKKLLKFLLNVK
jgi:AcrR family transcriptional regulator